MLQSQCPVTEQKTKHNSCTKTESTTKRKCNDVHSECMTRHKRKLKCIEDQRDALQKAELVNIEHLDSDARKYVFTSSLELVSTTDAFSNVFLNPVNKSNVCHEDLNESLEDLLSPSGKSDVVFTCNICEQIFNCQRKLLTHRKKHLTCNICKKHSKTWKEYVTHLQISCYVSATNPVVTLTRIDRENEIVEKYPHAFETLKCEVLPCDIESNIIDLKEEDVKEEEIIFEEYIEHVEENSVDDNTTTLKSRLYGSPSHATTNANLLNVTKTDQSMASPHQQTSNNHHKREVVEIVSNDQNGSIPINPLSQNYLHYSSGRSPDLNSALIVNNKSSHNLADFRYKDIVVQQLFQKYTIKCKMKNANTSTLLPSASSIVYTPTSLVTYKDLVKHLSYCKIPVMLLKSNAVLGNYYLKNLGNQNKQEPSHRFNWSALSCTDFVTTANNKSCNIFMLSKNMIVNQSSIPPTITLHQTNQYINQVQQLATYSLGGELSSLPKSKSQSLGDSGNAETSAVQFITPTDMGSSMVTESHQFSIPVKSNVNIHNTVIQL